MVERLLLTLLCNGNVLVEGLPGLAKTRAVKALANNLEADFSRIQFTPDLLPSDITGSEMYLGEDAEERFSFQPGPIFANIVLADEVNRAMAKSLGQCRPFVLAIWVGLFVEMWLGVVEPGGEFDDRCRQPGFQVSTQRRLRPIPAPWSRDSDGPAAGHCDPQARSLTDGG